MLFMRKNLFDVYGREYTSNHNYVFMKTYNIEDYNILWHSADNINIQHIDTMTFFCRRVCSD